MQTLNPSEHQIMEVIVRSGGCELEELVLKCEGLTWNQVFLAIDALSRTGGVQLTIKRPGVYSICERSQTGMTETHAGPAIEISETH
jgi:hypothetical protein